MVKRLRQATNEYALPPPYTLHTKTTSPPSFHEDREHRRRPPFHGMTRGDTPARTKGRPRRRQNEQQQRPEETDESREMMVGLGLEPWQVGDKNHRSEECGPLPGNVGIRLGNKATIETILLRTEFGDVVLTGPSVLWMPMRRFDLMIDLLQNSTKSRCLHVPLIGDLW